MFEILRKSFRTGIVTTPYPPAPTEEPKAARGRPEIDYAKWKNARAAAEVCPTGAISCQDDSGQRTVTLDLGLCTFCGLCAEVEPTTIRMTTCCELATRERKELKFVAQYRLNADGSHRSLIAAPYGGKIAASQAENPAANMEKSVEQLGQQIQERARKMFGHSLHIREVAAGSCNGCEVEIVGLNSPVYDLERFGIHFVASPRHADLLLVTGPVSRNMELALRKTYAATPPPRLVVAVGACGCGGGMFGQNYASVGGVDKVVPVDVYIPGCPPNPYALLQGIMLAMNRRETVAS
jgi:Ni,Fe-hydrogenase III small subunit/formate hydrogenlyase subunit 6/NADH:ubiquinone oxidoreductase subunit I